MPCLRGLSHHRRSTDMLLILWLVDRDDVGRHRSPEVDFRRFAGGAESDSRAPRQHANVESKARQQGVS